MAVKRFKAFLELEASGGIVLALAAIVAMIIANSPLSTWYESFIHAPVAIQIGSFAIAKDAHHWINDGLMAIFGVDDQPDAPLRAVNAALQTLAAVDRGSEGQR